MSQRRMFSPQIVESDEFLEMPPSSQSLYFHLAMRADDDGFVQPKSIMKLIGSGEDDLKVLLIKRFILPFESGVVVIKHWLIHNMIRADRYKETRFEKEKELLAIRKDFAYTEINKIDGIKVLPLREPPAKPNWLQNREKLLLESELPYSFTYKIRQAFWGKKCPICSVEMREHKEISKKCIPTIQHIIPLSKGGKHELGNIAVICHNCNVSIQDKETEKLNCQEVIDVWNTIGNQSATQVRLGKVRLGKDNIATKVAEKTPIQLIVDYFFELKGWANKEKEFYEKNKIIYPRFVKPAKELYGLCDNDLEEAKSCLKKLADWADSRKLSWSIETVMKKWYDLDILRPKEKKAYFEGNRVFEMSGRKYVLKPNGEKLEFNGKESEIVYE